VSSRRLVRVFQGHTNRITDVCLSGDGRWVSTASADRSLRIYDIPTARLIDWVRFDRAVTGVAMSPSGDFVSTSHAGSLGIYLWANRTHFANVFLGYSAPTDATDLRLPTSSGAEEARHDGQAAEEGKDLSQDQYPALMEQLTPQLITFSTVPRPRWQTLANLDDIKKRNRPAEAPKAPEEAPFFLPTLPGLEPVFVPEGKEGKEGKAGHKSREASGEEGEAEAGAKRRKLGADALPGWGEDDDVDADGVQGQEAGTEAGMVGGGESRLVHLSHLRPCTKFVKQLRRAGIAGTREFGACVEELAGMSVSAVDLEIRSLSVDNQGEELGLFIDMFASQLPTGRNFELLQAYLAAFLRIHEDAAMAYPGVAERLALLSKAQRAASLAFKAKCQEVLCLVGALANIQ